ISGNTATVTLDGVSSSPRLTTLTRTVFTIGVVAPAAGPEAPAGTPPGPTPATPASAAPALVTAAPAPAAPAPSVTLPPTTATATISRALALSATANGATAADAGGGLSRSTTFVARTGLDLALTSSQDRQVTAAAVGGSEDSTAPPDGKVRPAAAEATREV